MRMGAVLGNNGYVQPALRRRLTKNARQVRFQQYARARVCNTRLLCRNVQRGVYVVTFITYEIAIFTSVDGAWCAPHCLCSMNFTCPTTCVVWE